ncbi:glycosyltransferase family 2 protein [Pontibacter sp. FD36]|uniref:glycosyltransferase family 2 protein n=1 Tax=Pontibacter sp. FD36 TaxID=2789860 RepID=UPI0018AC3799|nr:glycosyltransferase family A protein [Pontibacter sp. FD36]MBF8964223.1 glycosyltransferase family 2 protein [Pontibacter sp. FD36]
MPLFSIITPTFNRADLLPKMIESVKGQTFTDWELIIVDDGSTENSPTIVDEYQSDARIRFIQKDNTGAAHSRNVGAESATGDFLTFLDSDDEVKDSWLMSVSEKVEKDTGLISVGAIRKFPNGSIVLERPYSLKLFSKEFFVKFTAGSLFVRRKIFQAVKGYDTALHSNHHTDLGYRLMMYWKENPFKISNLDECLIQINVHEGARIRTNWQKVSSGTLAFTEKHYVFLKKHKRDFLSNSYSVVAHSFYKLKNKENALSFTIKAIKYRPFYFKNYARLVKYLLS